MRVLVLLAVTVLSSCAVGPHYQRPKINTPAGYRGGEGATSHISVADLPWWELFKDDGLTTLVKKAVTNNYDVQIAATRVQQAREIAAQARSQYLPFVSYTVSSGY